MAIGTGTAIGIGVSSLFGYLGARRAAGAADKAADVQEAASDKSLALVKEMYEQDRADRAPYRALGRGAVGGLGHLAGVNLAAYGDPAPSASAKPGADGAPTAPSRAEQAQAALDRIEQQPGVNRSPRTQAVRDALAREAAGTTHDLAQPTSSWTRHGATPTSMVRVQAPDGEVRELPPDVAYQALQAGGRRA